MAKEEPKHIVAKPIRPDNEKTLTKRELWAEVAYNYPQYTLKQASELSTRDVKLLLRIARREKAVEYFNLTQIAAAPHTEKGKGVKKLTDNFRKQINN